MRVPSDFVFCKFTMNKLASASRLHSAAHAQIMPNAKSGLSPRRDRRLPAAYGIVICGTWVPSMEHAVGMQEKNMQGKKKYRERMDRQFLNDGRQPISLP